MALASERPNVILFLADDMGYGDVSAHGNPILKTPNFDRLHAQSVRFTNFNVSPSCAPTRAALLTGKHEFRSGVTHTIRDMKHMSLDASILPQLFKQNGYVTGMFGKWHLGLEGSYNPSKRGFDVALHCQDDNYKKTHNSPTLVRNGSEEKHQGYRTDIFFKEAMTFVQQNKDRPFFVYLATHAPHSPHKPPRKYAKPFEAHAAKMAAEGKKATANYFGAVAHLDEKLGELLDFMEAEGLDDNTLLIAMTDNGGTGGVDTFNAGRRGTKGTVWSGGTRAFSFWKWGDRFPAGDRPQMAGHVDIYPTFAEICGFDIPDAESKGLEGDSLLPVLQHPGVLLGGTRMQAHHVGRWDDPHTWPEQKYADCSVTWKTFALVRMDKREGGKGYTMNPQFHHRRTAQAGVWELYDLETDPAQSTDIAARYPEVVERMAAFYDGWWRDVEMVLTKRWGK